MMMFFLKYFQTLILLPTEKSIEDDFKIHLTKI